MKKFAQKYSIFPFAIGIIVAFLFFSDFKLVANALSPNYSKTTTPPGNSLNATDWNNLPNDFVAKSGGTDAIMTGPLTLPGDPSSDLHAATKRYVDDHLPITNGSGDVYRMFCGASSPSNW